MPVLAAATSAGSSCSTSTTNLINIQEEEEEEEEEGGGGSNSHQHDIDSIEDIGHLFYLEDFAEDQGIINIETLDDQQYNRISEMYIVDQTRKSYHGNNKQLHCCGWTSMKLIVLARRQKLN